MKDVAGIFERYQAVRPRLPKADFGDRSEAISSLLDIAEEVDAFVFDAFGVLNVGDTPIPGAAKRLDQLRDLGKAIRILSNAASYNHDKAVEKFQRLGMQVAPEEIITSRDAALMGLDNRLWGCIAAKADDLSDIGHETLRLGDERQAYDRVAGFLFLSTESWNDHRQALLGESLSTHPRPVVIANADLAAPRDYGFSLEPGYYGHLLADGEATGVRFFGKPFSEVYELAKQSLPGIPPQRIAMCGDTLHTDILGGAARGWRTVLVERDGMFAGADVWPFCQASGIYPTWRLGRI